MPAAQCRSAGLTGQFGNAYFAFDQAVIFLQQGPCIGPVAHEEGIGVLKHTSRFLFFVIQHTSGADGANPGGRQVQSLGCLGIANGDFTVGVDHRATALPTDPLKRIASEAFIGLGLKHIAMKICRTFGPLASLNLGGTFGQLLPSLGYAQAILFQEVCTVVQQACIGVPRHAQQLAVDRVVGNDGRKVLGFGPFAVRLQVRQVIFQKARPHRVNLHHINVARFGGKQLTVQR